MTLESLSTPAALIDVARMNHNIERMQQRMNTLGVSFRPHVKTTKCEQVVKAQMDAGARGITVSTLKEAEQFFVSGIRDIVYAVGMAPPKLPRALALRRQWLIEQGLAFEERGVIRYQTDLLRTLHQRELRPVAWQLAQDLGLDYAEHRGGRVEGTVRRAVQVGGSKYALIETSREFTLVPWRPVLEKQIGRYVSGIDRAGSISWTIGRGRSGPER